MRDVPILKMRETEESEGESAEVHGRFMTGMVGVAMMAVATEGLTTAGEDGEMVTVMETLRCPGEDMMIDIEGHETMEQ